MSAHPCPTCGLVHEVPPPVDWTHFERDVLALVDMWLTGRAVRRDPPVRPQASPHRSARHKPPA
jgi:hypothetical protein